jgi:hypothetical protein
LKYSENVENQIFSLIVQKYQDANRALLRLQAENDDLKQQIEQITK